MDFILEQDQSVIISYAALIFGVFITLLLILVILVLLRLSRMKSMIIEANEQLASQTSALFEQQGQETLNKFLQQYTIEQNKHQHSLASQFDQQMSNLRIKLLRELNTQKEQLSQNHLQTLEQLLTHLNKTSLTSREELSNTLAKTSEQMSKRIDALTTSTDKRLQDISGQVEKRLSEGFEKTTKTFTDILQRLSLIDDAQKKITELSTNVVSLQEVLTDKRSRGAFGEVQLNGLIRNVLPENSFKLQHTLSNGKIADCVLFLPKPTGNVVVDAKFPLESYRKMVDFSIAQADRNNALKQFKLDIKKHVNDISEKYLINNETADGAIMFIPAEAIFAQIHGHHSDLVEYANKKRVWLTSPTTLMAILTTARSVLKDEATRAQIHIIQDHLSHLSKDFDRFKGRFANLARHIDQAAVDVKKINTSADKISDRFEKIEQVELQEQLESHVEKDNE
ncbi:MAG: DNA recombination protein RmuC [Colwellia sp.]